MVCKQVGDMSAKEESLTPAFILSSHTMGLGVIRSLGIMGVPLYVFYYEKKDMGYVSKYVTKSFYCPHPEKEEKEFIELLIEQGKRVEKSVLMPVDDATLKTVSRNKALLGDFFKVACPEWETTRKFIDKKYTYELAEKAGVPCPRTIVPKSVDEAAAYAKDALYPCVVKPCESHRYFACLGKKMTIVDNAADLVGAYKEALEAGFEVMLQEYIPGGDALGVNYNSYVIDGEPLVEFTAEKVRYSPPGIGVPRVVVSKLVPEVIEPGRKILRAMGYYGYSCTEFKKDPRDGIYKLLEINGRHNRSALLAVRCGINFPWIEYAHLCGKEIKTDSRYPEGIYWVDELRDIIHSIKYFREEKYTFKQYIQPYISPNIYAIFNINDLKPFMKRVGDIMKMVVDHFLPSRKK